MKIESIKTSQLVMNEGQVAGLPTNPRQWTQADVDRIAESLRETPELFDMRPCIVYPHGGKFVILGGNLRYTGAKKNKAKEVPCIVVPEDTPMDTLKAIVIKDNGSFGSWDYDMLGNEWDSLPLSDWGVPAWDTTPEEEIEEDEIERKRREFEERMAAGEISEEDEEYQEFLEKFALKKTTDDCYTPAVVYEAVADWVANEYKLDRARFVRPFYPGGDYQNEKYKPGDVVVDNPPFSILSEILKFYKDNGIHFFLFAPALTLFTSASSELVTAICTGCQVTYANGAGVNTSFLTDLEDPGVRARSCPDLYEKVQKANNENVGAEPRKFSTYIYDPHVILSYNLNNYSRYGIDFRLTSGESARISRLDIQREKKKELYGGGYLIGGGTFEERKKADEKKASLERKEIWELSEREKEIVRKLSNRK